MPRKAARPCSYPGCPALVREGNYCAEHQRKQDRAYNSKRGTVTEQGYGADWQKVRDAFIAEHPYCAKCGAPATIAHHVIPLRAGGDNSTLMPLCKSCHERLHARGRFRT